jgi:hypothetical protein
VQAGKTCGAIGFSLNFLVTFSFVLIQKKQKIKENPPVGGQAPIAPRVFPGLRAAKAGG